MKRGVIIVLVSVAVVLVILGAVGFYFYNKYSEEIGILQSLKDEADTLFNQGITGPDNCSSFAGCIGYCNSNKESCVEFCEDNSENELCQLVTSMLGNPDFDLSKIGDSEIDSLLDSEEDGAEENEAGEGEVGEGEEDGNGVGEPEVLCAEDSVIRGFGYSYYAFDMTGPICMGHAIDECATLGKIVAGDFFEESLLCCEWDCVEGAAEDCVDTDGGINIWIKGSCTDEVGVNTDACSTGADFTDFLDETWCAGGICVGAFFSCFAEEATCYDGKCIPNNQDSDGDGFTDLDEYQEGTNPNDDSDYPAVDCAAECLAEPEGFIHSAVLAEMELPCLETGMSVCAGIGQSLFMTEETAECCCIGCMPI